MPAEGAAGVSGSPCRGPDTAKPTFIPMHFAEEVIKDSRMYLRSIKVAQRILPSGSESVFWCLGLPQR